MNALPLFLFACGLGVVAAIPVGACQIEVAKRAINDRLFASQMVVLGSVSSDIIYGGVALFGLAPFLETPGVLAMVSGIGAVILWVLAYLTWRESRKPPELRLEPSALGRKRWAYLTGLTVGLSNPPMILSWLFGVTLARRFGLAGPWTTMAKVSFIAGGALGLAGYLAAMGIATHRMRHFISAYTLGRIYSWLAVVLALISLYFVHGAVVYFMHGA